MTDTLRGECSEWFRNELGLEPDEEDLLAVIAFARAHQAKGLREAAKVAKGRAGREKETHELQDTYYIRTDEAELIMDYLEVQATARERGA